MWIFPELFYIIVSYLRSCQRNKGEYVRNEAKIANRKAIFENSKVQSATGPCESTTYAVNVGMNTRFVFQWEQFMLTKGKSIQSPVSSSVRTLQQMSSNRIPHPVHSFAQWLKHTHSLSESCDIFPIHFSPAPQLSPELYYPDSSLIARKEAMRTSRQNRQGFIQDSNHIVQNLPSSQWPCDDASCPW